MIGFETDDYKIQIDIDPSLIDPETATLEKSTTKVQFTYKPNDKPVYYFVYSSGKMLLAKQVRSVKKIIDIKGDFWKPAFYMAILQINLRANTSEDYQAAIIILAEGLIEYIKTLGN